MKWFPGPPPDESYGTFLVVLDEAAVKKRYAASGVEYYGSPVAVQWWGHKGKDTLGQTRVDADLVLRHAPIKY